MLHVHVSGSNTGHSKHSLDRTTACARASFPCSLTRWLARARIARLTCQLYEHSCSNGPAYQQGGPCRLVASSGARASSSVGAALPVPIVAARPRLAVLVARWLALCRDCPGQRASSWNSRGGACLAWCPQGWQRRGVSLGRRDVSRRDVSRREVSHRDVRLGLRGVDEMSSGRRITSLHWALSATAGRPAQSRSSCTRRCRPPPPSRPIAAGQTRLLVR